MGGTSNRKTRNNGLNSGPKQPSSISSSKNQKKDTNNYLSKENINNVQDNTNNKINQPPSTDNTRNLEEEFPCLNVNKDDERIDGIIGILDGIELDDNIKINLRNEIKKQFSDIRSETKQLNKNFEEMASFWSNKKKYKNELVIIVEPKDKNKTSVPEMKKKVKESLDPIKNGFQINKLKTTIKTCKTKICTNNEEHHNQMKQKLITELGESYVVREPIQFTPPILLKNVEKDLDNDTIKLALLNQNKEIFEDDDLKILFSFGRRDSYRKQVVIKTSKENRRKILTYGRVHLSHSICYVDNYIDVAQCNCCYEFGHKNNSKDENKKCKKEKQCRYCPENHNEDECPVKNDKEKYKCINCIKANKTDHNHEAMDKHSCSIFKNKLKIQEQICNNYW